MTASHYELSLDSSLEHHQRLPHHGQTCFWGFLWLCSSPWNIEDLLSLSKGFARAPKSHIGGSGMTAVCPLSSLVLPRQPHQQDCNAVPCAPPYAHPEQDPALVACHVREQASQAPNTLWHLFHLGSFLVPLFRGVLILVFLGLLRLLVWRRPFSSKLCTFLCFPFCGRCCDFVLPLGNVARPSALLDWSPHRKQKGNRHSAPRPSLLGALLHGVCAFLGLLNVPGPFSVSFPCAYWILSPTPVSGMAREGWPEDLPARASLVPVFTPVITEGVSDAWSPTHDPERTVRAEDSLRIRELPWPSIPDEAVEDPFLGCYVYTPHYCPVALAVRMPAHADLRYAMDVLTDCAPGVPEGLFNAMVPIHPQRVPGFLSVIRFAAHIRGVHDGYSAVICDLTRIGGSYFATVLPTQLSHDALVEFLTPLAPEAEEPIRFYVGCRTKVWPTQALVTLRDGDAITAVRHLETTVFRHRAESLHDSACWGSMQQFFAPDFKQATCVLHGDQRFRLDVPVTHGTDLFDQVVSELQLDASRIAICSFPLEDLEVHGTRCPLTVAVADVPGPTGGHREPRRQDFFVLCDLRPLGLEPRFVHAHLPRLHLPSLIADLGIALPAAFQVGLTGARVTGEVVHVSCNCTLLFYAKELETDESVSITDLSPVHEPPEFEAAPSAWDVEPGAESLSPPQFLDPTIPEGHGWNLATDEASPDQVPDSSEHTLPAQIAMPTVPTTAQQQPARWSYASYCTHMAGAWEELGPEEDRYNDHVPDSIATDQSATRADGADSTTAPVAASATEGTLPSPRTNLPELPHTGLATTTVIALILAPDYSPEYISARVQIPCGIQQMLAHVAADRYGPLAAHFPKLVPAVPQPYAGYLLFVSAPVWLAERPVVILDCQRILQTVMALLLYPVLTRESLLLAAGLRHDSDVSVFVHGLLQPLSPGQRISLVTGMVISFVPRGSGAPATFDLAERLQSPEGWDPNPSMPGPGYYPGETFWVLTDGQPTKFPLGYRNRLCLHAELCLHIGSEEHRLAVVPAKPPIQDAFPKGCWTTNVVVATERISNTPFPPARTRDNGVVLILDCRPNRLGFRWLLLQCPHISVSEVSCLFQDHCPADHLITITGCATAQRDNDIVFPIQSGQVLVISLVEDLQSSDPPDIPPDDSQDGPPDGPGPESNGPDTGVPPPTTGDVAPVPPKRNTKWNPVTYWV